MRVTGSTGLGWGFRRLPFTSRRGLRRAAGEGASAQRGKEHKRGSMWTGAIGSGQPWEGGIEGLLEGGGEMGPDAGRTTYDVPMWWAARWFPGAIVGGCVACWEFLWRNLHVF